MQVLTAPEPHVVSLSLDGKLTKSDMTEIISVIENKLRERPRISLLTDITRLDGITPSALIKDLAYGLRTLGRSYRFDRMASISDNAAVAKLTALEEKLIPGWEMKVFSSEEREQAISWVGKDPEIPPTGIKVVEHVTTNILELEFSTRVTGFDVKGAQELVCDCYHRLGMVKLLIRVPAEVPSRGPGFWYELWQSLATLKKVSRLALVGPLQLRALSTSLDALSKVDLRHFPIEEHEQALLWLNGEH